MRDGGGVEPSTSGIAGPAPDRSSSASASASASAEDSLRSGAQAQQAGDQATALDWYLRAIDAQPDGWVAHTCAGTALKALGRADEAIAMHRRAVGLGGDHRALSNLALALREAGRLDEAIAALGAAVGRAPGVAELHGNLAGLLLAADRPAEAEAAARAALALAPAGARFETNLGYARKEQGDLAGAALHLRRAIAHDAKDADAHWNLGLTLLTAPASPDDEREGWRELEWRHQIPGLRVVPTAETVAIPRWAGEPLDGLSLLLQAEQGLGDTLQLVRYARAAKRLAGASQVILECQPPLARLMTRCAGVDRVVARGDRLPPADVRAGLFSLPPWLGGRAGGWAGAGGGGGRAAAESERDDRGARPYLDAEPVRADAWRARLDQLTGNARIRVGIAWQGNRRYRADGRRSIPLACFHPVVRAVHAAGGAVISLQKGEGRAQLTDPSVHPPIVDLGEAIDADGAFLDTAAVIAGLDLVVTSDTAIPHLAGALGAPVWMALAHLPDWRWGTTGDGSDWYPSMRVYRQSRAGDWTQVMNRLALGITDHFSARTGGVR